MNYITDTLCAIECRAERTVVQELRLMTQEILAIRTQPTLKGSVHADALLLKLSHLECCQQVEAVAAPSLELTGSQLPALTFDTLKPLQPCGYLVHFYSQDLGDLEWVEHTESLAAAVQLVRQHLCEQRWPVWQMTHDTSDGELSFPTNDDVVLVSIRPSESVEHARDRAVRHQGLRRSVRRRPHGVAALVRRACADTLGAAAA